MLCGYIDRQGEVIYVLEEQAGSLRRFLIHGWQDRPALIKPVFAAAVFGEEWLCNMQRRHRHRSRVRASEVLTAEAEAVVALELKCTLVMEVDN